MFQGAVFDVALGVILIFLVASLLTSAAVEAIGALFHRRSKNLWDTLDLMLGNTSPGDKDKAKLWVDEVYRTPFVTDLVRPTNRDFFDPSKEETEVRVRAKARSAPAVGVERSKGTNQELMRRYYGPQHIDPRDFADGLLTVIRREGTVDAAIDKVKTRIDSINDDEVKAVLSNAADGAGKSTADVIDALTGHIDELPDGELKDDLMSLVDTAGQRVATSIGEFINGVADLPTGDLKTRLTAILEQTGDDIGEIRDEVEKWYERHMLAASEWFRKQTRWFLFLVGLLLAGTMNIDALHAAETLYVDDDARSALVAAAETVAGSTCDTEDEVADAIEDRDEAIADAGDEEDAVNQANDEFDERTQKVIDCLNEEVGGAIELPIGWGDDAPFKTLALGVWVPRLFGWMFVAAAVTLGAPFWFDILRRALAHKKK